MNELTWNAQEWKRELESASRNRNRDEIRALRVIVYNHTLRCVSAGGYTVSDGKDVEFGPKQPMVDGTRFYNHELPNVFYPQSYDTEIRVINGDTLNVAKALLDEGLRPVVLNMANRQNPGGGVSHGSGAQEENLFRRTNLFCSLYQYASYANRYGVTKSHYQYPLDWNWGGVYTPDATVFRGTESEGYPLLENPYQVDFIAVPAVNHPELDSQGMIVPYLVEATKNKMRTIFRIALINNNDSLVLGALGCGAFRNPPQHVAQIFHQVMSESEFDGKFKKIHFAILDDYNTGLVHNPNGNYMPFVNEFSNT